MPSSNQHIQIRIVFSLPKDAAFRFNLISVQIHVQPMYVFGFSFYMTSVWVTSLPQKIMLSDRKRWKNKLSEHLQNHFCNEKQSGKNIS